MNAIERMRATYDLKPTDRLFRKEFGIWPEALDRWRREGMPPDGDLSRLFGYDENPVERVDLLGWCEPPFLPALEEKVLEITPQYDIVRDVAGRTLKCFKGRRHGFMPAYLKHAVTCRTDWERHVAPLLSTDTPERRAALDKRITELKAAAASGAMISQTVIGGYMYLRSLVGPTEVCYMFVDDPSLVHAMMRRWFELADAVTAQLQRHLEIDEIFFGEDICYNHGLLISPAMVREFLFPYYSALVENARARQSRRIFFQIDTDGNVAEALPLYLEIGVDVMSPFEVAAGNDALDVARRYPDLVILGGIDKRVLAAGPRAIDDHLEKLIPFMVERGGYIPTCDHAVPDDVSFENYLHYRTRIMELDH